MSRPVDRWIIEGDIDGVAFLPGAHLMGEGERVAVVPASRAEAAEARIAQLEEELVHAKTQRECQLYQDGADARVERDRLRAALEFYAAFDSNADGHGAYEVLDEAEGGHLEDRGEIAQAALSGVPVEDTEGES